MPELLEDAEERVYYRLPLVEDRKKLKLARQAGRIGPDLIAALDQAALALAKRHREHTALVEKLHEGILYRADFQVMGFWTLCLGFERLRGRRGWFFGARPEFYFPMLPISWGMIGTLVFLPPLVALLVLRVVAALNSGLSQALPPLP
jgi:hypothetical protein